MKRFIIRILLFGVVVALFDYTFGIVLRSITQNINIGGVGRDNYICDKVKDDILIFGSSRAEHHYNAQMITDSLGVPCYNCGEGGCGIILAYGRLMMMLERYTPKSILYEITPIFDFHDGKDNTKYLYRLKQHYDRKCIDSIFWSIDPNERYKMKSSMYQFNSSFLQNLIVYLTKVSTDTGIRGFVPFNERMDTLKIRKNYIAYDSKEGYQYDSIKLKYLEKFIEKANNNNINLVFVVSPMWYGQDTLALDTLKCLIKGKNIPLVDFSNDPKYVHNNEFFRDGAHLNSIGADEFTRDLIKYLKRYNLK